MSIGNRKINIAIDGPAGAGKSTISRMVAKHLGFIYVDTGAMYRAITLKAMLLNIDDVAGIVDMASNTEIELIPQSWGQQILLDGQDVTEQIRSNDVNQRVSQIAQIEGVRELLTAKQQQMAKNKGIVMDGRDIGTAVLPDAELKIYLSADVKERARRRWLEMKDQSDGVTLEQLEKDIEKRDLDDMNRTTSPLTRAPDAIYIDSTNMTISEVTEHILQLGRTIMGEVK